MESFSFKQWMNFREDVEHEEYPFKAIILAGGPGAGKSTVIERAMAGMGFLVSNVDKIGRFIAQRENLGLKPDEKDAAGNLKPYLYDHPRYADTKRIAAIQTMNWQQEGKPLILDGTARDFDFISKFKELLENKGYDVYMVFVSADREVAWTRNQQRERSADRSYFNATHNIILANAAKFKNLFGKNFLEIDNSDDEIIKSDRESPRPNQVRRQIMGLLGPKFHVNNPIGESKLKDRLFSYHRNSSNLPKNLRKRIQKFTVEKPASSLFNTNSYTSFHPISSPEKVIAQ